MNCQFCKEGKCIINQKEDCSYKTLKKDEKSIIKQIETLEKDTLKKIKKILSIKDKKKIKESIKDITDQIGGIKKLTEILEKEYTYFIKPNPQLYRDYIKALLYWKKNDR